MNAETLSTKRQSLSEDIQSFTKHQQNLQNQTWQLNGGLVLLGLILSTCVTVAGILNQGLIAALLGAAIALSIGLQNAFALGAKSEFHEQIAAEGENLLTDIRYNVNTEVEFGRALAKFQTLRRYSTMNLPRGQGMETAKNMYKELTG